MRSWLKITRRWNVKLRLLNHHHEAFASRDTQMLTGGFFPVRDQEIVLELDYSLQLAPWWTFQADIQEIIHPGGHVPDPLNPAQAIRDAFVVGGRSSIRF